MKLSYEVCDFSNPVHIQEFKILTNHYMADPMGDADPHNELEQQKLVDALNAFPTTLVVFVLVDGSYAGLATCFVVFSTFKIKPYLYIHDIVVHSDYRNSGLGRGLLETLSEISKERGYCKITLEVREDNHNAKHLYQSVGFAECDPVMHFWTKML